MDKIDQVIMKKLTVLILTLGILMFPIFTAYAAVVNPPGGDPAGGVQININPSRSGGINADAQASTVIGNVITIVFAIAALLVLFMMILGAFNWITSGGDKEHVAKARNRITHALIGLLILALAFFIVKIVGGLVHVNITTLNLPALDQQ